MRIYSYILRHDSGFAPNPFHSVCTLACCKPVIRRMASPGDLVIGLTPKHLQHRLAFAMEVDEVLTFDAYWADNRFKAKRPRWSSSSRVDRVGDNCYEPVGLYGYRQHPSIHSHHDGSEDAGLKTWDLSGKRVLVSKKFWYFGSEALNLMPEFEFLKVGRGHRSLFSDDQISAVIGFLNQLPVGLRGAPRGWPDDDDSWTSHGSQHTKSCR